MYKSEKNLDLIILNMMTDCDLSFHSAVLLSHQSPPEVFVFHMLTCTKLITNPVSYTVQHIWSANGLSPIAEQIKLLAESTPVTEVH